MRSPEQKPCSHIVVLKSQQAQFGCLQMWDVTQSTTHERVPYTNLRVKTTLLAAKSGYKRPSLGCTQREMPCYAHNQSPFRLKQKVALQALSLGK